MVEVPNDEEFKKVVGEILKLSKWSDRPFELPLTLDNNYANRVHNILGYLADQAEVLNFEATTDGALTHFSVDPLPNFEEYAASVISTDDTEVQARLSIDDTYLILELGKDRFKLHSFKEDARPFKIIGYLLNNEGVLFTMKSLTFKSGAVDYKDSPVEFVRQLGFANDLKSLKDLFFPVRSKSEIRLQNPVTLHPFSANEIRRILAGVKTENKKS